MKTNLTCDWLLHRPQKDSLSQQNRNWYCAFDTLSNKGNWERNKFLRFRDFHNHLLLSFRLLLFQFWLRQLSKRRFWIFFKVHYVVLDLVHAVCIRTFSHIYSFPWRDSLGFQTLLAVRVLNQDPDVLLLQVSYIISVSLSECCTFTWNKIHCLEVCHVQLGP